MHDIDDRLYDKFFDPVINAKDEESLRAWLQEQPPDEIELFLHSFDWKPFPECKCVLEQELRRLRTRQSMKDAETANEAGYTMDAAKAVYAAIEGLVSSGKRAYSHNVPMEAANILVKQGDGRISFADAYCQSTAAVDGLSRDGNIEAPIEQRKNWLIKKPLQEEPTVLEASPALASQAAVPVEKRAELLTLKPALWGFGIDLKEVWRRLRARWGRPS